MGTQLSGSIVLKTYYSSDLDFEKKELVISDTQDYLDTGGCWEEYYIIKREHFQKLLKRLKANYSKSNIEDLNDEENGYYNSLNRETDKKIYLHLHYLSRKAEKRLSGESLAKEICGSEIPYDMTRYSSGP
jgi:hypothetical protein